MRTCSQEPIDKIRLPALRLLKVQPLRLSAGDDRAKGLRPPPRTTLRNNEARTFDSSSFDSNTFDWKYGRSA